MDEFRSCIHDQKPFKDVLLPAAQRRARRDLWTEVSTKYKHAKRDNPEVEPFVGLAACGCSGGLSDEDKVKFVDNMVDIFAHEPLLRRQVLEFLGILLKVREWFPVLARVPHWWRLDLWNMADQKAIEVAMSMLQTDCEWVGYESVIMPNKHFFLDLVQAGNYISAGNNTTSSAGRIVAVLEGAQARDPEVAADLRPSLEPGEYTKKGFTMSENKSRSHEEEETARKKEEGEDLLVQAGNYISAGNNTTSNTPLRKSSQPAPVVGPKMEDFCAFLCAQPLLRDANPRRHAHGLRKELWSDVYEKYRGARKEMGSNPELIFKEHHLVDASIRARTWDNVLEIFSEEPPLRRQVCDVVPPMLKGGGETWIDSLVGTPCLWRLCLWNMTDRRAVNVGTELVKANIRAWALGYESLVHSNRAYFSDVWDQCKEDNIRNETFERIRELLDGAEAHDSDPQGAHEETPCLEPGAYTTSMGKEQVSQKGRGDSPLKAVPSTEPTSSSTKKEDSDHEKQGKSAKDSGVEVEIESDSPKAGDMEPLVMSAELSSVAGARPQLLENESTEEHVRKLRERRLAELSIVLLPQTESMPTVNITTEAELILFKNEVAKFVQLRLAAVVDEKEIVELYTRYWVIWMNDILNQLTPQRQRQKSYNMDPLTVEELNLQVRTLRSFAYESELHIDGSWFRKAAKASSRTQFLDSVGEVGKKGNACQACTTVCYVEPHRIGKHNPRYCGGCEAWFCGSCKKSNLKKVNRVTLPGYGSFEIHQCKKETPECRKKENERELPLDPGTGGILRDEVFLTRHREESK